MNLRFVLGLILSVLVLSLAFSTIPTTAATSLQIISPKNGQTFYYGQQLVLVAEYVPGAVATIYLVHGTTAIPEGTFEFNSSGYLTVDLGTFGSGNLAQYGTYVIEVEVSSPQFAAAAVTVYYVPFIGTIIAQVQNPQQVPIAGATVYLYNTTAGVHTLVATATTNSSGIAVFHVTSYNFTQTFEVVASMPGYLNASSTVSIYENQTATVTLTLYPAVLNVYVVAAMQNGVLTAPVNPSGYTYLVATQGANVTVFIETLFAGMQITNATVYVTLLTPTAPTPYLAIPITSGPFAGYYAVSFKLPPSNVPYDAVLNITATYQSLTSTIYVTIEAQVNYTALAEHYISELNAEIESVNNTVHVLMAEISALNASLSSLKSELSTATSEISSLQSSISSLQSTVNSLQSSISSLNSTVSSLSGTVSSLSNKLSSLNATVSSLSNQVSSLNSKLNSITPLVYGGLIAGIIGLIIAIVAIVLVYRKIS